MESSPSVSPPYAGYGGYSAATVLPQGKGYVDFESRFALEFHLKGKSDWGRVADFGGGIGQKTRLVKNVVVVEADADARAYMKGHEIPCAASLEEFPDGHFDLIYCSGVLEHLETPFEHLKLFRRKLKDDGRLFLGQPMDKPTFETMLEEDNGHLYTWTPQQLNLLLRRAGFSVLSVETFCFPGFPILSRFLNKRIWYWKMQYALYNNRIARKLLYLLTGVAGLIREIPPLALGRHYISTIGLLNFWAAPARKGERNRF